jgi:magnesium chelatase subunit I
MTGKLELEYEGELVGSDVIARELIRRAAGVTFTERAGDLDVEKVVAWFDGGGVLRLRAKNPRSRDSRPSRWWTASATWSARWTCRKRRGPASSSPACELVLEGLAALKRISRNEDDGSWGRARPERRRPRSIDD